MPNIVGIVKEISGSVVVKDELGVARTLNLGDEILLGESVETLDVKSKVVISMKDGEEVVLVGEDLLVLDQNFLSSQGISNVFASAEDISDLQKAIIEGKDLNTLEATAAGGGSIAGGEGTSLSSENFTSSGNISNVFEGYGDLDNSYSDTQPFSSSSGNGNFASEAGVEEINSNSGNESSAPAPQEPSNPSPQEPSTPAPVDPVDPVVPAPQEPSTPTPQEPSAPAPQEPSNPSPQEPSTPAPVDPVDPVVPAPQEPSTPTPQEPSAPAPQEPSNPSPQEPSTPAPVDPVDPVVPAPQDPKPNLNITVEKITPKLNTNLDSFESQMGLQSKFFYLPPEGEAYISHAEDESKGWTLHSFQNIDQALDFASQGKVDATYQVKKIDFQTREGEDLAKNTASSLEDSPLARFLGDNAHSLKAAEGTDYAVGKNEAKGERSLNIMEGYLFLEKDKDYRFKSVSDDGIRIKIGDKVLFNDEDALKGHHDRTMSQEDTYKVDETGFYKMDIAHYDIGYGNATLKLFTIEDGKDLTVGDYKNGGIPIFTDISDMVIVDGKLGKVEGYEAEISVRTDIEANVDVKITDKEGGLINNVGSLDVSKDEVKTITHTLQEPLKEDDLFTVEYKDEQGNVVSQASTTIKDSNAQVIEVEAIKVFEDTDAKTTSHENSQSDASGQDQDTQNENINMTAISSLSEQSDNKPASGSLPQGILTQDNKEVIPGLESPKAEEGVVNSANETDTQASPSLVEQASETNTSSVVVPMNTEDTTTISGF